MDHNFSCRTFKILFWFQYIDWIDGSNDIYLPIFSHRKWSIWQEIYWLAAVQDGWHWTRSICTEWHFAIVFMWICIFFFVLSKHFPIRTFKMNSPDYKTMSLISLFPSERHSFRVWNSNEYFFFLGTGKLYGDEKKKKKTVKIKTHLISVESWNPVKQPKHVHGELDATTTTFFTRFSSVRFDHKTQTIGDTICCEWKFFSN